MHAIKRQRRRAINLASALVILAVLTLAAPATRALQPAGPTLQAVVLRWVDGDTLVANIPSPGHTRVRLIGIDAPETSPNSRARYQAQRLGVPLDQILASGRAATSHAARLAPPGSTVTLELDVQISDRHGRLLAYVCAGHLLVNVELVRAGYACPITMPPNVRHATAIVGAAREARQASSSVCW